MARQLGKMVEDPKSRSTQPRFARRLNTLYVRGSVVKVFVMSFHLVPVSKAELKQTVLVIESSNKRKTADNCNCSNVCRR